jgi:rod shape-determining protein MreD
MRGKVIIFCCLFLIAIVQLSMFPVFFQDWTAPSLILILVVFFASRRGLDRGIILAIASGFILDTLSFWPIGTNILILVVAAYLAGSMSKRFLVNEGSASYFLIAGVLVLAILSQGVILLVIAKVSERFLVGGIFWPASWQMIGKIALNLIYSLVMLILLYPMLRKIDKFFFGPVRNIYL